MSAVARYSPSLERRAVAVLGAFSGAAFGALVPALLAIPLLGEWPSSIDWIAIALISIGVYLVSGGPLPAWRDEKTGSDLGGGLHR